MEIHVGFTGTQQGMSESQWMSVYKMMTGLARHGYTFTAHHGDCIGADKEFHGICRRSPGLAGIIGHPPDLGWKRAHCDFDSTAPPLPYLERNRVIVDCCQILIAAPKEHGTDEALRSGTWSTVRYARKRGKRIYIVRPSGLVQKEVPNDTGAEDS